MLTDYGKSVILVGENGCGKSAIINDRIRTVYSGEVAEVLSLSIQANRFTNARLLYDRLDERLEWKHGSTYVPKGNKRLLCLVDDINLAQVKSWGAHYTIRTVVYLYILIRFSTCVINDETDILKLIIDFQGQMLRTLSTYLEINLW